MHPNIVTQSIPTNNVNHKETAGSDDLAIKSAYPNGLLSKFKLEFPPFSLHTVFLPKSQPSLGFAPSGVSHLVNF